MKRPKNYMPRRGMRFDRFLQEGMPDTMFVAGDGVDNLEITGSVARTVATRDGDYRFPSVPFMGYPQSDEQMRAAVGGGIWDAMFSFDSSVNLGPGQELSFTSDFGTIGSPAIAHVLYSSTDPAVGYPDQGPRTSREDDYAFTVPGTHDGRFVSLNTGSFSVYASNDLAIAFVARFKRSLVNDVDAILGKYHDNIANGYALFIDGAADDSTKNMYFFGYDGSNPPVTVTMSGSFTAGNWFVFGLALDRVTGECRMATKDLNTGKVTVSDVGDFSSVGAMAAYTLFGNEQKRFSLGGIVDTSPARKEPQDFTMAALYMGVSSGSARGLASEAGIIGLVTGFANVINATKPYLFSGSFRIDNSIASFGAQNETAVINRYLLGLSSGGLGYTYKSPAFVVTSSDVPSWTNVHLGQNAAFVVPTLSSSNHESQVLNLYRSGTEALETTAVPASASLYYSKHGRYQHVIVKHTASALDTHRSSSYYSQYVLNNQTRPSIPWDFVPGKGTNVSHVSFSFNGGITWSDSRSSPFLPAVIPIDVPYSGKIVDIKVWIDIQHTSGSGLDPNGVGGFGSYPLGRLQIALKSPNVRWGHAHPIYNDPNLKRIFSSELADFSVLSDAYGGAFFGAPNGSFPRQLWYLYESTFLLWEGPYPFSEGSLGPWDGDYHFFNGTFHRHYGTSRYPAWQRDRSMRVVFSDGAAIPNPRHLDGLPSPSASYNGAPNAYFGLNCAYGFDVPWTSETEISGAGTYVLAGSPPKGWLTGPGGTPAVNEWPTTGVNYGADYIKPLYPLLDPVYQRKRYGSDIKRIPDSGQSVFDPDKWLGYRPGLRGTEASGTWELIIADNTVAGIFEHNIPTYLRQFRLEFILESGSQTHLPHRGNSKLRPRRSATPILAMTISGTDGFADLTGSWGNFLSDTYYLLDEQNNSSEIGRTMGVAQLTGSQVVGDFALFYRLTGTLADLSGSYPGWLLNNGFGMPAIPLSSASLTEPGPQDIISIHPQDVITTRPLLDGALRLADAARDASAPQTRAEYAAEVAAEDDSE